MASDKSRISYDERQRYRSVVYQQGKALIESDLNEAQDIASEELRREALDFVGPTGSPDDGYRITIPNNTTNANFAVEAGSMYVGGVRVERAPAYTYETQPEWRNPDAAKPAAFPARELVWLDLIEQEVSATEDGALLEPALGGPDTAARSRIIQHIRRGATSAANCSDALAAQITAWAGAGLTFVPGTRRLLPVSTLKVTLGQPNVTTNACDPVSKGGYAGAENQLVRVRISAPAKLTWAYDNASAIYKVDHYSNDRKKLTLKSAPVDDAHRPKAKHLVELLRGSMPLADGEFVAEGFGPLVEMDADFDPDGLVLSLKNALPNDYSILNDRPLFVRIWQEEKTFTPNTPVALGSDGVNVTLAGAKFVPGDFWTFAVRPLMPADVYPARYATFQSPEGPRRWATPLAVLDWSSATAGSPSDCREVFDNLVELTKRKTDTIKSCCSITISGADLRNGNLQEIIDKLPATENAKICFLPGRYELESPVKLRAAHNGITFEGCRGGVIINGSGEQFANGFFELIGASGVTFRGIDFRVSIEPVAVVNTGKGTTKTRLRGFDPSIGSGWAIRAIDAEDLHVEECTFVFPGASVLAESGLRNSLGIGIFAAGRATGLVLRRNQFLQQQRGGDKEAGSQVYIGYALAPAFIAEEKPQTPIKHPAERFTFSDTLNELIGRFRQTPRADPPREMVAAGTPEKQAEPKAQPAGAKKKKGAPISELARRAGDKLESPRDLIGDMTKNVGEIVAGVGEAVERVGDRISEGEADTNRVAQASPVVTGKEALPIVSTSPPIEVVIGQPGKDVPPDLRPVTADGKILPAMLLSAEISGNDFAGCHTAVWICADNSLVRIHDNRVAGAFNGFFIVATAWMPVLTFMSPTRLQNAFQKAAPFNAAREAKGFWDGVQASAELIATVTHQENCAVATALVSLKLPPDALTLSSFSPLTEPFDDSRWVSAVGYQTGWSFYKTRSHLALPDTYDHANMTFDISKRVADSWQSMHPLFFLADTAIGSLPLGTVMEWSSNYAILLDFAANTISTEGDRKGDGGSALIAIEAMTGMPSSVTVTANTLTNDTKVLPTAVVAFIGRATTTGNIIYNESAYFVDNDKEWRAFWSYLLLPGVTEEALPIAYAVTGNSFKGWPVIPPRTGFGNLADPFDTWLPYNAITW
jgi:hypothetical protein